MNADLTRIRDAVEATAYPELIASFAPTQVRPAVWAAVRDLVPRPEADLLSFLLLTERVGVDRLPPVLGAVVPDLVGAGVCDVDDGGARLNGLALVEVAGHWVFVQQPQLAPTMYFGDDTLALVRHVRVRRGGEVLDLCSGPGSQALAVSPWAAHVVAVEINPVAAALATVNVALNGLSGQISVRQGDLYGPVGDERFDTVVANPPLLPIPAEMPYPFVGAGGETGLDVVLRILEGAPDHLTPAGTLHLLGTTLTDGFLPVATDTLRQLAQLVGLDLLVTITAQVELHERSWWSRGVGSTIAALSGRDVTETVAVLNERYRRSGGSHVCGYFLRARLGTGEVRVVDVSTGSRDQFWYV